VNRNGDRRADRICINAYGFDIGERRFLT